MADGLVEVFFPDQGGLMPSTMETVGFFGELSLLADAPRCAGIRALRPSLYLAMNRFNFENHILLASNLRKVMNQIAEDRRQTDLHSLATLDTSRVGEAALFFYDLPSPPSR